MRMIIRDGSIFGAEKCLKEFKSTCLICFADAVLVQRKTSNMHQKCAFEQFKMHQRWYLTRDSSFFSPKLMITCQIAILVHYKLFKWALLVYIRSNTLHQNWICEDVLLNSFKHVSAPKRNPSLITTLIVKKSTSYQKKHPVTNVWITFEYFLRITECSVGFKYNEF